MEAIIKGDTKKIDHDSFMREMVKLRDKFDVTVNVDWYPEIN